MCAQNPNDPKRHGDVLVGVALVGFCAIVLYLTTTFREVPASLSQNVPPTFFPRLVLGIMALLSLALVGMGWKRPTRARTPIRRVVLATAGMCVAAAALLPYIGMLLTMGLAALALAWCWGERNRARLFGLAIGLPTAIYLVFGMALGMRFPRGLLW